MNFPTLYHKGKGGELRQWRVWSEGDTIFTEYGHVGGALQTSEKKAEPKNVGKKNETTAEEQAAAEAQSMWTHKVERKYSTTPEAACEQLPLPMLAHPMYKTNGDLGPKGKKLAYPVTVQPKLDGVRCMAQWHGDRVVLMSRQGKEYTVPHISAQLAEWLPQDMVLDGELYIHGMSLQKITSLVKKNRPESVDVEYHVYDVPVIESNDTLPWGQRKLWADNDVVESSHIKKVVGVTALNEEEVRTLHGGYLKDGYEGAIVRHPDGLYLWGYRSEHLLKVKVFQDAEFEVIGARDGKGKMAGCVVWRCRNDLTDGEFECSIKATMEERAQYYRDREKYMGWKLTVRFFARTDDNIPQFPIGIGFRAGEDLP